MAFMHRDWKGYSGSRFLDTVGALLTSGPHRLVSDADWPKTDGTVVTSFRLAKRSVARPLLPSPRRLKAVRLGQTALESQRQIRTQNVGIYRDRDQIRRVASSVHGLARRALQAAKRKIIYHLGFVSDQKFYLDSGMVSPRSDVERIMLYCDAVDSEFLLPVDGSIARNSYRPRFVYGLTDATIDPISNLVYDGNGQFIAESSSWLALRQFYSWPQPKLRASGSRLRGEFVFLPTNGYYHWLIEDLPVFLKSLAVAPRARVILPRAAASYVREVAELIDNDIVYIGSPVRVERLVMTAKTAGLGSPLAGLTPHPADVAILRKFFAKYHEHGLGDRRLYLSRVGQKRSPANELAVQLDMEKHGYIPFDGAGMSLFSQVALFSSARQLVGMHGAAFANIVWAPEGIDVCEIFSSGYMPSCYSALTAIRRGSYTPVSYTPGPGNVVDAATVERLAAIARRIPVWGA